MCVTGFCQFKSYVAEAEMPNVFFVEWIIETWVLQQWNKNFKHD